MINNNKYGLSYKPKASTFSICKLNGNGHIPSIKRISDIKINPVVFKEIPGYIVKNKDNKI